MKKISIRYKRFLSGLLTALAILMTLSASVSLAHPPLQGGNQPHFTAATYASADGSSIIQSQETRLTGAYFAANGSLEGVAVTPDGLTLAEGQTVGAYLSEVINAPLASTTDIVPLWSADLPAGTELRVETHLSLNGGPWSEWVENPEAFYPVRDGQHGGTMIWVGGGQAALQFRVTLRRAQNGASPTLHSLTLVFSDADHGPTAAAIASRVGSASTDTNVCPPSKPTVASRTDWGCPDGQNSPRQPPIYHPVTHIVIHHTATPNDPDQDWAKVVRAVWNYHANSLGWGDVGYNYLIDPKGVIYEGRAGGDDVVGIHDRHNYGSMAIGFIGCYGNCGYLGLTNAEPGQAMLDSGVGLMAWKLGQKGIDPHSRAPYDGLPDIPVIAGGRDVTTTLSPGDNLYNKQPWFRDEVAKRLDCHLTPCSIDQVDFDKDEYWVGETIHLTVKVSHQGEPLGGAKVTAEVEKPSATTYLSAAAIDLIDLTGGYEGSYSNTDVAGVYTFKVSASDPTGQRFTSCYAEGAVCVVQSSPTPPPDDVIVKVEPEYLSIPLGNLGSAAINVKNVTNLYAVSLEVRYDPQIVRIADADPDQSGVQVRLGDAFLSHPSFIGQNEADNTEGRIEFAATLIGSETIEGDAGLIVIDWCPQNLGTTQVRLENVELVRTDEWAIPHTRENGSVEVTPPDCWTLSGVVALQGRSDYSGVTVTSANGVQTQTDAQGFFSIQCSDSIKATHPGFLAATAEPGMASSQAADAGAATDAIRLGSITLLAGDVNADDVIDIFDLALIAGCYGTDDPIADINASSRVDVFDLALTAGNYRQQGPLTDWQ